MEVEFGSSVAHCPTATEYEHILEDELEEGLKKSALQQALNNNATSHPIEKATTNVVCIKFAEVNTNQNMSTGDAISCAGCHAVLNCKSVVTNGTTWACEFCSYQNQLQVPVDAHEIPTESVTEYLLEPPGAKNEHAVIFCLDVSGSMAGERIFALRTSLDQQLVQLSQTSPDSRVALIIFHSDVTFFSGVDGSREVVVRNSDKAIESFELMQQVALECKTLGKIRDTVNALRSKVRSLREVGSTALGPALLMGVCVAGAMGAGSQVVTCTDGQANVGLGVLNELSGEVSNSFYDVLANTAKQQGVSVSVMSFKGTDVKLEKLAVLADYTGGTVKITDLGKLAKSFGNVVSDTVVAWGVEVAQVYSRNVQMTPEDKKSDLGNCIKNSEVTAEFNVVPVPELANQDVLFQTQVRYTRVTDGARMLKVFTRALPVSQSRADAEGTANLALLALHAVRSCAKKAQEGVYTHARLRVFAQQRMLARIAQVQGKSEEYLRFLADLEIIDGELRYSERQEEKSGLRQRGDRDRDRDRDRRDDRRNTRDDRGANVFYQMKSWHSRNMRRSRSRSPPRQRHRSRSRSPSPTRSSPPANSTLPSMRSGSPPMRSRTPPTRSRSPPMRQRFRSRSPPPRRDRDMDRIDRDIDIDRRDRDRDRDTDRDRDIGRSDRGADRRDRRRNRR